MTGDTGQAAGGGDLTTPSQYCEHLLTLRGSATKSRLSRVALELFAEKGVDGTTVRDIAQAAGVAEGSLYRHFEGKDALAWELYSEAFASLATELDRLQGAQETLRAKLEAMIGHVCSFFDRDRPLFSYLLLTQHGQLRRITTDMPHPMAVLRGVLATAMRRGEARRLDADLAASMVMGLTLQVAVDIVYGRLKGRLATRSATLVDAACRLLAPS